jgi:hypothetical protein
MIRRLIRILIAAAIGMGVLVGGVFVLIKAIGGHERLYQGKPLRRWIEEANSPEVAVSNGACVVLSAEIVPQLVRTMFEDRNDSKLRLFLIDQLNGLPGVNIHFTSAEGRRAYAAQCLGQLGRHGEPAIPELIAALKSKDSVVRPAAARALGDIRSQPDKIIPLLMSYLEDPQDVVPEAAVEALGQFGGLSKAAVPKLLELYKLPDKDMHAAVAVALKRIDPEEAAKTGIK